MLDYSREFIALAQSANFRAAAAKLNLSQPTLSRHIAELERELGFKLLERNPVALTVAGKRYLEAIGDVIDRLDAAIESSRALAQTTQEVLKVAMLPSASLMTDIAYAGLALLREERPMLSLRVCTDKVRNAYDLTIEGEADLALLSCLPEVIPFGFTCTWLTDCESALWTHRRSPLLTKPSVTIDDLAEYHLIASTNKTFDSWTESQKHPCGLWGLSRKCASKHSTACSTSR